MRTAKRVVFHGYELDPVGLVLFRDGLRVPLAPQPLRLLALLVSRPGELVTREEIRALVWENRAVEFDAALNYAVAQLRGALHHPPGVTMIETVPRRGYRFVAPIGVPRRRTRRLILAAALLLAAAMGGFLTRDGGPRIRMATPVAAIPAGEALARTFGQGLASHLLPGRAGRSGVMLTLMTRLEPDSAGVRIRAELLAPGESRPRWRAVLVAGLDEMGAAARDLANDADLAARRITR